MLPVYAIIDKIKCFVKLCFLRFWRKLDVRSVIHEGRLREIRHRK